MRSRTTAAPARAAALLGAVLSAVLIMAGPATAVVRDIDYVVDGDTIRLKSGTYVRMIGIDTPEVGQCGYRKAKRQLNKWVGETARLVNPAVVDDEDAYDRLLRYVHASGRDTGLALIRKGVGQSQLRRSRRLRPAPAAAPLSQDRPEQRRRVLTRQRPAERAPSRTEQPSLASVAKNQQR